MSWEHDQLLHINDCVGTMIYDRIESRMMISLLSVTLTSALNENWSDVQGYNSPLLVVY